MKIWKNIPVYDVLVYIVGLTVAGLAGLGLGVVIGLLLMPA